MASPRPFVGHGNGQRVASSSTGGARSPTPMLGSRSTHPLVDTRAASCGGSLCLCLVI